MSNNDITGIAARRVWDSRGRPTVEVEATLSGGATGRAIAPAGASRGANEAIDLRDGGEDLGGFGVEKALDNIADEIAPLLEGMDAEDQEAVDLAMIECDDTDDKSRLGGNAIVAVSMAVLGAMAASRKLPLWKHLAGDAQVRLPMPEIQIFGGGAHAGRRVDIQDFMAVPIGAETFDEALEMVAEVYLAAGQLMQDAGKLAGVADEGGWWPVFETNEEALDALVRAIEEADLEPGAEVAISLDIAASEFGKDGQYRLGLEKRELDGDGMIELLAGWLDRYPIVSIEDPLGEDDAENMKRFTERFGDEVQIVGDDFLVTSAERVADAADAGICNSVLIKPNQAGTVTETKAALDAAKAAGWGTIVSARSGETEDVTIAHLAVGWNAGQLKVGSFARSERMAKWNEVLRIEEAMGDRARLAGT